MKYKRLILFLVLAVFKISMAQNSVIQFRYNPGLYYLSDLSLFSTNVNTFPTNSWENRFSGELQYGYFLSDKWQAGASLGLDFAMIRFASSGILPNDENTNYPESIAAIITPKISLGYKLGSSSYLLPTVKLGYSIIMFTGESEIYKYESTHGFYYELGLSLNIPITKYWGVAGSISYSKTLTTINNPKILIEDPPYGFYFDQPGFENPIAVRFGLGVQYMF